jgi:hypothetical protein
VEASSNPAEERESAVEDSRERQSEAAEATVTEEREDSITASEQLETAADPEPAAESDEDRLHDPTAVASVSTEPRSREPGDYDIGGEPPRERRANGDRQTPPPEPSPNREDAVARRSFLSRMFGKGGDY